MTLTNTEDLLILVKTYPSPSTKYRETTCVAAVNSQGALRRIFPVPFRLLEGEHQFKKWEWIRACLTRAVGDQRPESYRIDTDTIIRTGRVIGTNHGWAERRTWVDPHIVEHFSALESRRQTTGQTLGLIKPSRLINLDITPVKDPNWTEEDKIKLSRDGLFDTETVRSRPPLQKLPYTFHYVYECITSTGIERYRHLITDWEVGALYRNCVRSHGQLWERPFRQKLEVDFAQKDLMLLMGTIHRFPDKWLIVGLIYPAKRIDQPVQLGLGLEL